MSIFFLCTAGSGKATDDGKQVIQFSFVILHEEEANLPHSHC